LVHALNPQGIGHLVERAQSSVLLVSGSAHVPPNWLGTTSLNCVCLPDFDVGLDSHVTPPKGIHVPLLDHEPGTQFIGHLVERAQLIVWLVKESSAEHVPPFVGGSIIRDCNCLPDKDVALISQLDPPGTAVHDPLLVHAPGLQFVGHSGKEQGMLWLVAESAVEHDPLNWAGVIVRVCI
jgi:hypothetical protein